MATAMTAGATASGVRAYVAQRHFAWLTAKRLRHLTIGLIVAALMVSALFVSGSSAGTSQQHDTSAPPAHVR
jgi:hypothetical protein